uniref:PX domain-containing protein n=1 Tax=Phytophthora ramorum TaxID=164328 RepID=H3GVN7_PHYRM
MSCGADMLSLRGAISKLVLSLTLNYPATNMGCSFSRPTNPVLRLSDIEYSVTELSIAKRPGGPDVGPAREHFSAVVDSTSKINKITIGVIVFSVVKVVADNDGVMFYHFSGTSAEDPINEVRIAKRYSDFKSLHFEISELMANERNVPPAQQYLFETHPALPELPSANVWTYLRGRSNEKLLEEREEQFTRILNAISRHPVAFQSQPFTNFLLRR